MPWIRSFKEPDALVAIDYGFAGSELAEATQGVLTRARMWQQYDFPDTPIVYTVSGHCFPGSDEKASQLKRQFFEDRAVTNFIDAGPIINSVTEARAVRDALRMRGISPKRILVVGEELHIRSLRYIWSRVFPGVELNFDYGPHIFAYQKDHCFPLQRGKWRWLFANVARHAALVYLGLDRVAHIHHRPS